MGKKDQAASRLSLEDWKAAQKAKESAEAREPKQEQVAERSISPAEAGEAVLEITDERRQEINKQAQGHLGIVSPEERPKVAQPIEEATEQAEEHLERAEDQAAGEIGKELKPNQRMTVLQKKIARLELQNRSLDPDSNKYAKNRKKILDLTAELEALQAGGEVEGEMEQATTETAGEKTEISEAEEAPTSGVHEIEKQKPEERPEGSALRQALGEEGYQDLSVVGTRSTSGVRFEPRERTARGGIVFRPGKRTVAQVEGRPIAEATSGKARPDTIPPESGVRERKGPTSEDFLESEEFGLQFDSGTLEGDRRLLASNLEKLKGHVNDLAIGNEVKDLLAKSEKATQDYSRLKANGLLAGSIKDLMTENEGLLAWSNELLSQVAEQEAKEPEITTGEGELTAEEMAAVYPEAKSRPIPGEGQKIEVGEGELTPEEIAEFYPSEAGAAKGETKPEKAVMPKETEAVAETGEMDAEEILAILHGTQIAADYALVTKHLDDSQIGKDGQEVMRKLQESVSRMHKLESDIDAIKNMSIDDRSGVSGARDRRIGALRIKLDKLKADLPGLYLQFEDMVGKARELEAKPTAKAEQKAAAEVKAETKIAPQAEAGLAAQEATAPAAKAASAMPNWMMGMEEQMEEKQKGAPLEMLEAQERETKRALLALERISAKYKSEEISLKDRSRKNAMSQGYQYPEVAEAPEAEEYKRPSFHENVEPSGLELDIDVEKMWGGKQKGLLESRLKEVMHLGAEEWGDVYAAMDPSFTKAQWDFLDVHEKKDYQNLRKNQLENELKIMELQEKLREESEASRQEKERLAEAKKPKPAIGAEAAPAALPKTEAMPVTPTGTVEMSAVDTAAVMAASAEANKAEQAPSPGLSRDTVTDIQFEHEFLAKQKAREQMSDLDKQIEEAKDAIIGEEDRIAAGLAKKNNKNLRELQAKLQSLENQKDAGLGLKFIEPKQKTPEAPPGALKRAAKWGVTKGAQGLGGTLAWIAGKAPGAVKFLFWDSAINLLEAMVKWSDPGPALTQSINDLKKWGKEKPKKET